MAKITALLIIEKVKELNLKNENVGMYGDGFEDGISAAVNLLKEIYEIDENDASGEILAVLMKADRDGKGMY